MQKEIPFANGTTVTIRRPTEAEALTYLDKRMDSRDKERMPADALDDGDEELLGLVVSPSREQMQDLLEDYPLCTGELHQAFRELAGDQLPLLDAPELVTPERRTEHGRCIGWHLMPAPAAPTAPGGAPPPPPAPLADLVAKKISRVEMKFLQRETTEQGRTVPSHKQLAQLAREHVVVPQEAEALFGHHPLLAARVGLRLFLAANLGVREGK